MLLYMFKFTRSVYIDFSLHIEVKIIKILIECLVNLDFILVNE